GPGAMLSLVAMGAKVIEALASGFPSSVTLPDTWATWYGWPPQPNSVAKTSPTKRRCRIDELPTLERERERRRKEPITSPALRAGHWANKVRFACLTARCSPHPR